MTSPTPAFSGNHSISAAVRPSEHRALVAASCLLVTAIAYALAATTVLPRPVAFGDAVSIFLGGAVPGLVVTLLLSLTRPGMLDRRLRRVLISVSLSGAAAVALLPLIPSGI